MCVKFDPGFDPNFDTRQMCVKSEVMALPIHLILDKEEGKCDLNYFDSIFDARQRRNPKYLVHVDLSYI